MKRNLATVVALVALVIPMRPAAQTQPTAMATKQHLPQVQAHRLGDIRQHRVTSPTVQT